MLKQDWMMRQIETMTLALARFVFHKEGTGYVSSGLSADAVVDELSLRVGRMVEDGNFNGAENELFDALESGSPKALELAVDFYARLNQLTDETLRAGDYSRKEIEEGLQDAMDRYGVVLP